MLDLVVVTLVLGWRSRSTMTVAFKRDSMYDTFRLKAH
jgi:hypothetical protein